MNKVCKVCGKEYAGRRGNVKTCSKECSQKLAELHNQSKWKMDSLDGLHHAICPGCGKEFTSKTRRKYCSNGCRDESAQREAIQNRHEKMFCKHCGERIPVSSSHKYYCSDRCFNDENHIGFGIDFTEKYVAERIAVKYPHVEYAGGYAGNSKPLDIRCKECGTVFQTTGQALRKDYKLECPVCKELERKKVFEEKEKVALIRRLLYLLEKREKALIENEWRTRKCVVCGKMFEMINGNRTCCSDECKKIYEANIHRASKKRRRAVIKNAKNAGMSDRSLTWQTIYREERGICGICGGLCDADDYKITDGVFVAGGKYPSLDHIVALANGGLHIRSNVQLAHFECNWMKGAN